MATAGSIACDPGSTSRAACFLVNEKNYKIQDFQSRELHRISDVSMSIVLYRCSPKREEFQTIVGYRNLASKVTANPPKRHVPGRLSGW